MLECDKGGAHEGTVEEYSVTLPNETVIKIELCERHGKTLSGLGEIGRVIPKRKAPARRTSFEVHSPQELGLE